MAGDGGRVPEMSEQRAETWEVVVCNTCNVVLGRDGKVVLGRPWVPCSHLNTSAFVRASDPASVLAALLAESPEATVAAIEALLTSDEAVEGAARRLAESWAERANAERYIGGPNTSPMVEPDEYDAEDLMDEARRDALVVCRSLLSKAPKGDGESDEGGNQ
jgi:hypothetical protein